MADELPLPAREAVVAAELPLPEPEAAELPELGLVAVCIAVGCAEILKPLLDFLGEAHARSPVLEAAAAALVLTLPMAYLAGVMLLYLHVAPAPAAPVPPAALGRFAALVSGFLLFMALLFFLVSSVL